MKFIAIIVLLLALSSCSNKTDRFISTSEAYGKYSHALRNKLFFAFPEQREKPLKWYDSIPEGKLTNLVRPGYFTLDARPGELFVWQIGVWAANSDLKDVKLRFFPLEGRKGTIDSSRMTCYNLGGLDFRGRPFRKQVEVSRGRVQSLWIGFDLDGVTPGNYRGSVEVSSGPEKQVLPIDLKISEAPVTDHGYDDGSSLSRLNWLNSAAGTDDSITKGYKPVELDGKVLKISGRNVTLAPDGLPASVETYFSSSNQYFTGKPAKITLAPFRFIIEKSDGRTVILTPGETEITEQNQSVVVWNVRSSSTEFTLDLTGRMEFDGFMDYSLRLTATSEIKVRDIRLEIPYAGEKAEYMMGLGHEGGLLTTDWKWKWDTSKNQDMVWLGAVNGGMRIKLKDENYKRPLINVYYRYGKLNLPVSWGNEGKGGIDISRSGTGVLLKAFSGPREIKAGRSLSFNFELLVTPFRLLDRKIMFGDRYYHGGGTVTAGKVDSALKAGANIINIHHAEDIYPFINYPYLDANTAAIKALAGKAHDAGLRLKLYYTTREFTKNLPEFWAFNSLDGEIVYPGPGDSCKTVINPDGPKEWYRHNLRERYIPAWYNEIKEGKFRGELDLSVISVPDSRLNNFYVAGLGWMVKNLDIDGVYIDDSALDRYTLMRARKIIDRYRPEGRMDLHSWNHFNEWAGYTNCLNLYMDLLPYFDLIWIGEGRDYNRAPDHWLIEVSGIPFGLPGQMLEGGGNPWRGMVYGITNRAGYLGLSPSSLWKFWDNHNFMNKVMKGYWDNDNPVTTLNPAVKATVYEDDNELVIATANWTDSPQKARLKINRSAPGLEKSQALLSIPAIAGFQEEFAAVDPDTLTLPSRKGFLLILKKN